MSKSGKLKKIRKRIADKWESEEEEPVENKPKVEKTRARICGGAVPFL